MKPAEVSTPSDREVLVKRSFDAPVNLGVVWQAYTDPRIDASLANGHARLVDAGVRDGYSCGWEVSLALAR